MSSGKGYEVNSSVSFLLLASQKQVAPETGTPDGRKIIIIVLVKLIERLLHTKHCKYCAHRNSFKVHKFMK